MERTQFRTDNLFTKTSSKELQVASGVMLRKLGKAKVVHKKCSLHLLSYILREWH